jgi:hypothetical protein
MKIHLVGAELFHADGRTDGQANMTNLIFAFRNFANPPKTDRLEEMRSILLNVTIIQNRCMHCVGKTVTLIVKTSVAYKEVRTFDLRFENTIIIVISIIIIIIIIMAYSA